MSPNCAELDAAAFPGFPAGSAVLLYRLLKHIPALASSPAASGPRLAWPCLPPRNPQDWHLADVRAETRQTRPGRPPGSKNRRPATRHDVGKTVKREEPKKKTHRQAG